MDINAPLHIRAAAILKLPREERSISTSVRFMYMRKHVLIHAERELPVLRHAHRGMCLYRDEQKRGHKCPSIKRHIFITFVHVMVMHIFLPAS